MTIACPSGAWLSLDTGAGEIELISPDGTVAYLKGDAAGDLFDGSRILHHVFPESILLMDEGGSKVMRFSFGPGRSEVVRELHRTDLWEEGFDYCGFLETGGDIALVHELGVTCFDAEGRCLWFVDFPGLQMLPHVHGRTLVYQENEGDRILSLETREWN